jgi:hypothetical protein
MYLSVQNTYRSVEAMRPEVSDKTKKMVETSLDHISDNPAINSDDLNFDQQVQFVIEHWWKENQATSTRDVFNKRPWEK